MRKGMDGLAALVQTVLGERPFSGDVFVFRGKRGDLLKLLWWSGDGMNLYAKRLERGVMAYMMTCMRTTLRKKNTRTSFT